MLVYFHIWEGMVDLEKEKLLDVQKGLNNQLATTFVLKGIKHLRLTSLGNSIASGYSCVRTTKPLLFRNESIEEILKDNEIKLERYHFARAQNNNDEHVYRWLVSNIKETEINKMNRQDYGDGLISMPCQGLTDFDIERFYPIEKQNDRGLQDVIFEHYIDFANIVIYNGCTGSFLDNITRGGRLREKFTYGFHRDITSIEATLKYIQISNRERKTNTQVYLCGAPNFLGLGITNIFINNQLKSIAEHYANVTYVEPIHSKFLYRAYEGKQEEDDFSIRDIFSLRPDVHYDECEYLQLNNHIIKSIIDHYLIKQAMIELDRNLYHLNCCVELEEDDFSLNYRSISPLVEHYISKSLSTISDLEQEKCFLSSVREYLLRRVPYDFYYLSKKHIKNSIGAHIK